MRRLIHFLLIVTSLAWWLCASNSFAQVNAPSQLQVLPRYNGGTITLVLSWIDNANIPQNEQGFEIQARETGGIFATIANVGPDLTQYEDAAATGDKWWEYRVRATHSVLGNSGWSNTSAPNSPRQIWPINTGKHNILYRHAQPIQSGGIYFHGGTDISGAGDQVDLARGGIVQVINNNVGGTLELDVDYGPNGIYRDWYLHTNIDPVIAVGDNLVVADKVGNISTTYFGHADQHHVHWGWAFDSLARFTADADRDPNIATPVVADTNGDGKDFIVVNAAANDHTKPREPAWGGVDFLVDAFDDMTPDNNNRAAPLVTGYWIEAGVPGGENVRDGINYYRLLNFNFERTGYSTLTGVEGDVVYTPLPADLQGANIWPTFLTWIVTNTRGTDGALTNVDGTQFWKTDAQKGTGIQPNGSDAGTARENQEARFPDGMYFVHVMLEDYIHTSDNVRSVLVDNSRPYVKSVTVYSGARIVYQSKWAWDAGSAQLSIQPATFDAAAPFTALRTQDVTIEVEFSEPMKAASVTAITPLGKIPTLSSDQPEHARTVWKGIISNLDIRDDGSDDGVQMIAIDGTDLAGNKLLEITNRNAMPANHHNRDASGNLQGTAGKDTIHGFKIGPLQGVISVTAVFMKQTAADPISPSMADKALQLQTALSSYFQEVSYGNISFAVSPYGWYLLQHSIDWYYTKPQAALIDLVQEAVSTAEAQGAPIATSDYVLVVTDETTSRDEWSTSGGWPYNVAASPGWKLLASGVSNLASSDAHLTNLAGRMVGLIDLFAYPEVTAARPFVGPWSHMADKENAVHVLGWEKWRAGWLDETGTATGNKLMRVAKPSVASPIVDQTYIIKPIDTHDDSAKMIAIAIGDRLHYTAEYRRQQNLDTVLPDTGVLITKTNDYINQGEGTAIIQESPVTAGNLSDAPFNLTASRNVFDDLGSGVNIAITSMNANQAEIKLNYAIPPKENDVFVSPHDERWKAEDIWIDAPTFDNKYEADPLSVKDADEKPVTGKVNKVYGRIRNQGHADATNFEVRLEIREPWGAGGPWKSLKVETVTLLKGQDNGPGDYYLIEADWIPTGDVHSCIRLEVTGVANDINEANNSTQENVSEFESTTGSPFAPVTTRFEVQNPFDENITAFFKIDGLPRGWSYLLTPQRLIIPPKGVGSAQVTIQPSVEAPLCSKEQITVSAHTPRVDTLKSLGAITLQTALKNAASVTGKTWTQCGRRSTAATPAAYVEGGVGGECAIVTQGCTNPKQPNTTVAVVYTAQDGSTQVHYVTTDENGCYQDYLQTGNPGLWQAQVVMEETSCRAEARTPIQAVVIPPLGPFTGPWWCWLVWAAFLLSVIAALLFFALWWYAKVQSIYPWIVAALAAMYTAWRLLTGCPFNACWFLLSLVLALVVAAFWIYVLCFRRRDNAVA